MKNSLQGKQSGYLYGYITIFNATKLKKYDKKIPWEENKQQTNINLY